MKVTPATLGIRPEDIIYWDMELDDDQPLQEQADALKEDLAQVSCPRGLLLDIGWYSSVGKEGCFRVLLVETNDWDDPVYSQDATCICSLCTAAQQGLKASKSTRKAS